jgi:type VI secretion system protein ImpL
MLDRSSVASAGGRDRSYVTFQSAGRGARFELRAGSVINPFTLRELGEFRCPPAL